MRNELNQIEKIELYLNGELNVAEQKAFENEMAINPELTELVTAQQLVQQAALRKEIRADVLKYGTGGGFFSKWWVKIAGLGLVTLLIGSMYWYTTNENSNVSSNESIPVASVTKKTVSQVKAEETKTVKIDSILPKLLSKDSTISEIQESDIELDSVQPNSKRIVGINDDIEKEAYSYQEDTHCDGLKTWAKPYSQMFNVDAEEGATIEGKDGTLIIVPKNAFEDKNGEVVKGKVEVELVEALQMSEMIAYNLTTMNGDKALQSGGMIYVQPRVNGKEVEISKTNPLYIEIPTDDYNANMMAWEGEVDENGDIDWNNPKPLEKYLTKVDFENLDFLPDGFESAVSAGMPFKSYTTATDELVDSLYYSLGEVSDVGDRSVDSTMIGEEGNLNRREVDISSKRRKRKRRRKIRGEIKTDRPMKPWIIGVVVDEKEEPIPFASVAIYLDGKLKGGTKTGFDGNFFVSNILPGIYELEISYVGYQKRRVERLEISENCVITIDDVILSDSEFDRVEVIAYKTLLENGEMFTSTSNELEVNNDCFIDPLSVKSIKTNEFANTFLATKEFQERIKLLHGLENAQELFDLYVNNLSKDLWEVDQMVVNQLKGEEQDVFQKLADQKLTNVENEGIHQEQLSAYYTAKLKKYKKELKQEKVAYAKSSTADLRKEQTRLNDMVANYNSIKLPSHRANAAFSNKATKRSIRNVVVSRASYGIRLFRGGWTNIDALVSAVFGGVGIAVSKIAYEIKENTTKVGGLNQTKLDNGKSVSINLPDSKISGIGRVKIYQCVKAINLVIPLELKKSIAIANFPKENTKLGKVTKETFCLAIKQDEAGAFLAYKDYKPFEEDEIFLEWEKIEMSELINILNNLPGVSNRIINELKREEKSIVSAIKTAEQRAELKKQQELILKDIKIQKDKVAQEQAKLDAENRFIESLKEVVDQCGILEFVNTVRYKVK